MLKQETEALNNFKKKTADHQLILTKPGKSRTVVILSHICCSDELFVKRKAKLCNWNTQGSNRQIAKMIERRHKQMQFNCKQVRKMEINKPKSGRTSTQCHNQNKDSKLIRQSRLV